MNCVGVSHNNDGTQATHQVVVMTWPPESIPELRGTHNAQLHKLNLTVCTSCQMLLAEKPAVTPEAVAIQQQFGPYLQTATGKSTLEDNVWCFLSPDPE